MMIHVLAQIVARQVCTPKEGIREEPDPSPLLGTNVERTSCSSRASKSAKASEPDAQTSDADNWTEPSAQALVVLFTKLAQRRVQAARAQEEADPKSEEKGEKNA